MLLRGARYRLAFEHLLDQVDAATRAVTLITQQLVGRAGSGAKAAMDAGTDQRCRLLRGGVVDKFARQIGFHNSGYMRPGLKIRCGSNRCFKR